MKRIVIVSLYALAACTIASCASQAPPPPPPVAISQSLIQSTPPPPVSTPVPVVHAKTVVGAGRYDPFVALYGPPSGPSPSKPSRAVSVSSFPRIPSLPGFEGGSGVKSVWDGVAITGIVRDACNNCFTAIVATGSQSFIVRQGDMVANRFRVVDIGPDFVTLVTTGSPAVQRTFSLGG